MTVRLALLAVTLTGFSAAHAAAEPAPDESEATIPLRFAWPAGLDVRVESTQERARQSDGKSADSVATVRYRMRTQPHDEGLRVSYADYEVVASSPRPEAAPLAEMEATLQRLGAVLPSLVVSPDGELLRVDGLEPLQQQLQQLVDGLLEKAPALPEGLRTLLRSATTEEALTARAAEDWNMHVGTWHGADFEPGSLYELETSEPLALLGNAAMPMRFEFSLEEFVPCHAGAAAPQCVVLVMDSAADPDTVRQLISGVLQGIPGEARIDSLEVAHHVRLVAEPATLLPHRLEFEKRVEATVRGPDGSLQPARQRERRTVDYTYAP